MNAPTMKTPQPITYIIVGTVCVAFITTVGTCAYVVITGHEVTDSVSFLTLKSIADTTLGAIVGFLANTRSAEVKSDAQETIVQTTRSVTPDPK